jgi:hypothetical protein
LILVDANLLIYSYEARAPASPAISHPTLILQRSPSNTG